MTAAESKLPAELRATANKLRTSSVPLSDFIPLLQRAADEIEELQRAADGLAESLAGDDA